MHKVENIFIIGSIIPMERRQGLMPRNIHNNLVRNSLILHDGNIKVLLAVWVLIRSHLLTLFSSTVLPTLVDLMVGAVNPASSAICLMYSLNFCSEIKGRQKLYFSKIALAQPESGISRVLDLSLTYLILMTSLITFSLWIRL